MRRLTPRVWAVAAASSLCLVWATPSGARDTVWIWNAGAGIQCDAANYGSPSAECGGYVNRRGALIFNLHPVGDVSLQRIQGNADEGFHPRPPARWETIRGRLQCRRGPGSILVQCRNAHHHFVLRAHRYSVS
jgi:hypothetical protein